MHGSLVKVRMKKMARLIDADELLTRIRLNYNNHQNISANSIKDIIDTTKTAYDVDAVVEELAKIKGYYGYYGSEECEYVPYLTTVGIVRKGGVNE